MYSHWPVISSTTPRVTLYHHHRRPLDTRGLAFVDPSSAAPKTFIYTRVTKIGLTDPDKQTEEQASSEHVEDDINQILTEKGILSICGIRPRSYPPLDALMEIRDSGQVAQPLAEKGRLYVIP